MIRPETTGAVLASTTRPQARTPSRPGWTPSGTSGWVLDGLAVVLLAALAGWLRADALGPPSLWLDDAWVALVSRAETLSELRMVGFSAPGFVLVLRAWFGLVGFSELAAQAVPFAAGAAAPPVAYLVGRRIGWWRVSALVPALVLAFSPMAMTYATRVKQYTVESLLALLLILVALYLLRDVGSARRWATFVGAAAVATTVSAFLAPYAAAGVAAGGLRAWRDQDRSAVRWAVAAGLGYGVLALAWYLTVLEPAVTSSISSFWSGHYLVVNEGLGAALDSGAAAAVGVLTGFSAGPIAVSAVLLLASMVALVRARVDLGALLLTPALVAVVLATMRLAPLGGGRTDVYLYPALALVLGAGAQALVRSTARGLTGLVPLSVGAGLLVVTPAIAAYPVQDVSPLVHHLERHRTSDEVILVYPATMWAYALYTPRDIALERDATSSWGFAPRFADEDVVVLSPGRDDPDVYADTVTALGERADPVWLLASHWRSDYEVLQEQLRAAGFERVDVEGRQGAELTRWEPTGR